MIRRLKRRLVLLYGITTSIILTVIVAGVFIINDRQDGEQLRVLFQRDVEQITEQIRTENVVSSSWLSKLWNDSHLYIMIEDSGKQLHGYNRTDSGLDSAELIKELKEQAAGEGIYLNNKPLFSAAEKTPVYKVRLDRDSFLGMAVLIPKDTGWLNIMAVYYDPGRDRSFLRQIALYSAIDLCGIAALFFISTLYIGKILKPLEEGQKEQNAFVASASHELRSPLTVIKAGVASLREDISKAEQFLPHIEAECNRMNGLVNDMLQLAASDAGIWSMHTEEVDMDTLLIESYDMYCTLRNGQDYQLALHLPEEDLHKITGDKERIKQILAILVDNAIHYSLSGEVITLRAYNRKRAVAIEVEDHGKGISEEDKKRIFERFYRGDKSRNEKNHFGLGLSIAKELIRLHDGSIYVKDTAGGGATFVLQLPC